MASSKRVKGSEKKKGKGGKRKGNGGKGRKRMFVTKDSVVRRSGLAASLKKAAKGDYQVSYDAVVFLMETVSSKVRALVSDAVESVHKAQSSTVSPRTVALVALYKHRADFDSATIQKLQQVVASTDTNSKVNAPELKHRVTKKGKSVYPWLIRKSACKTLMPRSNAYALEIIDYLAEKWLGAEFEKGAKVLPADRKVIKVKHLMPVQLPKVLASAALQKRGKGHTDAFLPALSSCSISKSSCKRKADKPKSKPKSKTKSAKTKSAKTKSAKSKSAKATAPGQAHTPSGEGRVTRSKTKGSK